MILLLAAGGPCVGRATAQSSVPGQPGVTLVTPGSGALRHPPLRRRGRVPAAGAAAAGSTRGPLPRGRKIVTESVQLSDGTQAVLQVLQVPARGLVDSLLVRRRDLAPLREREHVRGLSIDVTFEGRHVRWVQQHVGEAARSGDTTYRVPAFAFNQLEMLARALAPPPGRTAVVPMVSEGTAELELDTLTVVAGAAGRRPRQVRFADSAVVSHYTLAGPQRDVVALEIVVRESGARYTRDREPSAISTWTAWHEHP